MKLYHIYFFLLKLGIGLQIILIMLKKTTKNNDIYILSDTIFKISVALYLFIFSILYSFPGLEYEDILIFRFSGAIFLWDVDYPGLLKLLRKRIPILPTIPFLEGNVI